MPLSTRRSPVAVAALALAGTLGAATPAAASTVPAPLVPPAGQEEVARMLGVGVQVYDCVGTTWTFREPKAALLQDGRLVGTHYRGPTWESLRDGSKVTGAVAARAAAPDPARDIPWLLLSATSNTGTGVFADIDYIQRLDTKGGVAPTGACDPAVRPVAYVPYASTYVFFAPED